MGQNRFFFLENVNRQMQQKENCQQNNFWRCAGNTNIASKFVAWRKLSGSFQLRVFLYCSDMAYVVLEKAGVLTQVKDLLTKLLENRPENVVDFIAE